MKAQILSITAFVVLFAASCTSRNGEEKKESHPNIISDTMMSMIKLDTVRLVPIEDALRLTGTVGCDENHMAKVFSANSGQVIRVKVSIGDKVTKGQPIATIKSADIAGGYSDFSSAKADCATAKRNFENVEAMYKSGLSSEREYLEAKNNFQKAQALVSKAEGMLAINGGGSAKQGGFYTIKSPLNGYIVDKNITEGSFIRNDNGNELFTVASLDNVWIWANVFERDIANVAIGFNAKVRTLSYPDKIFTGKVDKATSVLDPVSKVMKVRVVIPNPNLLLKPGMYADVFVSKKESKMGLEINSSSVLSENGEAFVVVFKDRSHYEIRPIKISKSVGDKCYISEGLAAGEQVICQNQLLVYNQIKEKVE